MPETKTLTVTALPAFQDNYIWVIHDIENPQDIAVVDPGDAKVVSTAIAQKNWNLKAILITHHHHDHVGGLLELKEQFSVPVYGPAMESIKGIDFNLAHGDIITVKNTNLNFSIIDLPGHTLGHIAYYGHTSVFCGDTLFSGGCGRMFEGTPEVFHSSLSELAALPEETAVYCTHEYTKANMKFACYTQPNNADILAYNNYVIAKRTKHQITLPSTIALEKKINPFLHCNNNDFQLSLSRLAKVSSDQLLNNPVNTFATLRKLKDNF